MATSGAGVAHRSLLPIKAKWCGAFKTGTADANEGCFCEDGVGYVMKPNTATNPTSSHCEWFCAHLAAAAGIPAHDFNVIEHTDGKEWFGSAFGVEEIADWWTQVVAGTIKLEDLKDDLSRIYAFDLFVNNGDRHIKNY